jgi:hypothetical protein
MLAGAYEYAIDQHFEAKRADSAVLGGNKPELGRGKHSTCFNAKESYMQVLWKAVIGSTG